MQEEDEDKNLVNVLLLAIDAVAKKNHKKLRATFYVLFGIGI